MRVRKPIDRRNDEIARLERRLKGERALLCIVKSNQARRGVEAAINVTERELDIAQEQAAKAARPRQGVDA